MGHLAIILAFCFGSLFGTSPEADLLFAGDAMMHQAQIDAARTTDKEYDYSECFSGLSKIITSADFAVVNLETPCAGGRYSGYPCFNAPASYPKALKSAGFDLMLTANNHCLDRHDNGLLKTIACLDSLGIAHTGTFRNITERNKSVPLIRTINGFKIAFHNYTYGTNGIRLTTDAHVDYIDRQQIKQDISDARNNGAELICVCPNWGEEYRLLPSASQKNLADYIIKCGADMIIGSHPHVIQPMEIRTLPDGKKVLVVYSLGNFISNMKTHDTRGGVIVRVCLKRDNNGTAQIGSAHYTLVFTIPADNKHNFRVVKANPDSVPTMWKNSCRDFVLSATGIFKAHNKSVAPDSAIQEPRRLPPLLPVEQLTGRTIWHTGSNLLNLTKTIPFNK